MSEARRQAGRPKRGEQTLDRTRIGEATIAALTEHGATALSVSKIAAELGVRSQTLYHHVSTIGDAVNAARGVLFSSVDTSAFQEAGPGAASLPRARWEDAAVAFAESYYRAFRPLGQGNSVFFLHEITDPRTLHAYELFLRSALSAGLEGEDAMQLLLDIEHIIFSLIFEQVSWRELFSPDAIEREGADTLRELLRGRDASDERTLERVRSTVRSLAQTVIP